MPNHKRVCGEVSSTGTWVEPKWQRRYTNPWVVDGGAVNLDEHGQCTFFVVSQGCCSIGSALSKDPKTSAFPKVLPNPKTEIPPCLSQDWFET